MYLIIIVLLYFIFCHGFYKLDIHQDDIIINLKLIIKEYARDTWCLSLYGMIFILDCNIYIYIYIYYNPK
jgi:hypothetical protein